MKIPISRLRVLTDQDLVRLRRQARLVSEAVDLPLQDQTRLITALSEIARNAVQHAGGGTVDFMLRQEASAILLEAKVFDEGAGIDAPEDVVAKQHGSRPGHGLGVAGAKRLVHRFNIHTGEKGTEISLGICLPSSERRTIQVLAQGAIEALTEAVSEDPQEELVRQNRALVESLAEKDYLIREIHHRVKNNFQLISSLARLQARRAEGPEAKGLLESLAVRIRALGLAHEQLYLFDDLSRVGLQTFIGKLCDSLQAAFVSPDQQIEVICDVRDDLTLTQDEAIDIGVIVNELVTNSIKHGFPEGRRGTVQITGMTTDDELVLHISDDGVGSPDFPSAAMASKSLGMRLLQSSVRKLNGEVEFLTPERGAAVRVVFPRSRAQGRAFQSVI